MGGGNESANIVELTPEEHLVAHELLVKLNPGNGRLAHAANLMVGRFGNNKRYGWVRRRHAAAFSDLLRGNQYTLGYHHTDESKAIIGATHRGQKRTAETRARMSHSMRGNTNGLGKTLAPFTTEHRAKLSAAHRGKTLSAEHRANIGAAHLGKKWPGRVLSDDHKAKVGTFHRGRKRSPETCAAISAGKLAGAAARKQEKLSTAP